MPDAPGGRAGEETRWISRLSSVRTSGEVWARPVLPIVKGMASPTYSG